MLQKDKFKLVDAIVLMGMLSTLLSVLSNRLPVGLGSFRFFWGPAIIIVILITKPQLLIKSPIKQVALYGFFVILLLQYTLWRHLSEQNHSNIVEEFRNIINFSIIWAYYYYSKRMSMFSKISRFSFVFILITIITTNIALTINPLIIRDSANSFFADVSQRRLFRILGSAGYGYAQAFVMLIPILIYHIKKNTKLVLTKRWLWLVLFAIIVTTLRSQVFANMLVMIATSLLSFAGSKRRKAMYRYVFIFFLLFIIIPNSTYINLLNSVSEYFPEESNTYSKIKDLAMFIENPELEMTTGTGSRAARYPLLFEALLRKPIFGDASYESKMSIGAGGHLYLMNKLALFGIFGFSLFIYMLYKIYKSISRLIYDNEMAFYYFLSVLAFIMFGLIKTVGGREVWVFLIIVIPGLFLGTLEDMEQERLCSEENNDVQK